MKTTTTWTGGLSFDSEKEGNHIAINAAGGFNPKALLLSGLAACSMVDVVEILEKMRVPFAGLVVDAEAGQTSEPPKVFTGIELTFRIKVEEEARPKVIKAIELSLEKYCGVAAMLRKNSAINYKLVVEEPEEAIS